MSFRLKMEESERRSGSNIILALDRIPGGSNALLSESIAIIAETHPYLCAVKLNRHLVLPLGLFDEVQKIVETAHSLDLPVIMDCKINDIGYTNRVIAENYFQAGFDAVIANPFVGWEAGLQPVFEFAKEMDRGVILLVYMSHKAAWEGYGQKVYDPKTGKLAPQYATFAEKALSWKADGAVVGATYPEKIREVHAVLKEKVPIYSPGIGAQGGDIKTAVAAGSHYLIVGRAITLSDRPEEAAKKFRDTARCS
ncbi:MAG: orotidine 5'-phosphate decarboxylase [Candidatus Bathyarchaeota archaeon]|nr:orotidine 5'-phosphate decarboxylase [Candidatus Bathyarchaeota archaeon]